MTKFDVILQERLEALISAMGYEFVGGELSGRVLRLYIDKENGVTLDDCSRVSYQVSAMLDVEEPIKGPYTLEVSSPGLDRPLFKKSHYQQVVGNRVKLSVCAPIRNRRRFVGVLLRVDENEIHLQVDDEEVVLPFSNIEKARVIADIR